jgi:hypothetical protein
MSLEIMNTPIRIGFTDLVCVEDTNEADNDEPYCVMFVVDNRQPADPNPPAVAFRSAVFEFVDAGSSRTQWVPIWAVNGATAPIPKPEDVIILAALLENDSSEPDSVAATVQAELTASTVAARAAGLSRAATVDKLLHDMRGALALGAASGGIDQDEILEGPKEVALTATDLQLARTGHSVVKELGFNDGSEDAAYTAHFLVRPTNEWKGWEALGGNLRSSPTVASWAPFRLDAFARGADDSLQHDAWTGSGWTGWKSLGATFKDSPAAVSWGPNRIDVFVRGMDDHLGHLSWDGSAWHGWHDLGGSLTSAPAVASWGPGRLDVFARGQDQQLWHKAYDGQWHAWQPLGGTFKDAPAAISRDANDIGVFVRGIDDHLGHRWWTGSGWSGWEDLGGPIASGPAATSWAADRCDVFARGSDGGLRHRAYSDAASWASWQNLGGTFKGAPGAVSWGPNRIDVVVRGMDDHAGHLWWG